MKNRVVVWSPAVRDKLTEFRSVRFTPEETLDFIYQFIIETENLLANDILGTTYTEEFGKYKGVTRAVVKGFRVYYKVVDNDIFVLAVLFPGEK